MATFKNRHKMGSRLLNNRSTVDAHVALAGTAKPTRKGSSIKVHGPANAGINARLDRMAFPYNNIVRTESSNHGGTSSDFGVKPIGGVRLHRDDRVIWRINFADKENEGAQTVQSLVSNVEGIGIMIEARYTGLNFGVQFQIPYLPAGSRIVAAVTKVSGFFQNWESALPGFLDPELRHMKPGSVREDQEQLVAQVRPMSINGEKKMPIGNYQFLGVTDVRPGDKFIMHWIAIVRRYPFDANPNKIIRKVYDI